MAPAYKEHGNIHQVPTHTHQNGTDVNVPGIRNINYIGRIPPPGKTESQYF
jgi:hypothetical protein